MKLKESFDNSNLIMMMKSSISQIKMRLENLQTKVLIAIVAKSNGMLNQKEISAIVIFVHWCTVKHVSTSKEDFQKAKKVA